MSKVRRERNELIIFYVSKKEKEAIVNAAKANDMSISDFCRKTLISTEMRAE